MGIVCWLVGHWNAAGAKNMDQQCRDLHPLELTDVEQKVTEVQGG